MLYSQVIIPLLLTVNGFFASDSNTKQTSPVFDLFLKTLIKTFETPISLQQGNAVLSAEIMLANDVFNLDDALRLSIQQFLIALYDGNHHLLPDDWESRYPAYGKVIYEINNLLDLLGSRTLSQVGMKDIRPLVKALSPTAFQDLQRLLGKLQDAAEEEAKSKTINEKEL